MNTVVFRKHVESIVSSMILCMSPIRLAQVVNQNGLTAARITFHGDGWFGAGEERFTHYTIIDAALESINMMTHSEFANFYNTVQQIDIKCIDDESGQFEFAS